MWRAEPGWTVRLGIVLALAGAGTAFVPAIPADEEPRQRVEILFRRALEAWVEGDDEAPGRYAGTQTEVVQSRYASSLGLANWIYEVPQNEVGEYRPRGITCVRDTEAHTTELIRRRSPEALVALLAFHLETFRYLAAAPPRPWLYLATPRAVDRILKELDDHLGDGEMADLRVVVAGRIYTLGTYELSRMALEDLDRALDHDKRHPAALYWKAVIHEKLGETRKVHSLLEDLLELRPDAADARLRHAVNRLRRGDAEEGEALLEALATDLAEAPEHGDLRALAFQEWARSVHYRGDLAGATEIARRGVRAVPGNERLQMQLAYYLRADDPGLTLDLARRLLSDLRGRPQHRLSPRAVYELPAPELAGAPFERVAKRVDASRPLLREALAELSDDDLARTSWVKCRGW